MQNTSHKARILICSFIISATPLFGSLNLQVREGRPIVDGVYVDGHGPYRFLVDTGANVNMIDEKLAALIGLTATFRAELASATGVTIVPGSDGVEVVLGPVKADNQKFLFSRLEAVRRRWPDLQGLLSQSFLSQFDYTLDLRNKRLEFGGRDSGATRTRFKTINGRMAVSSSFGDLVMDSGTERLILFAVKPGGQAATGELRSFTGAQQIGMAFGKSLTIGDRRIWHGDAVAIPNSPEPGVDGLLPLILFRSVYVCNSEGYVVFE